MKRNKTNKKQMGGDISPYARHEKKPYRYSDAYYSWRREVAPKAKEAGQ